MKSRSYVRLTLKAGPMDGESVLFPHDELSVPVALVYASATGEDVTHQYDLDETGIAYRYSAQIEWDGEQVKEIHRA